MGFFSKSPARDVPESIELLKQAVRKLSADYEQLKDDLLRLRAQHESLRGYTYALKARHVAGLKPDEPAAPTAPVSSTKAELRKQLGIKPWEHKHE